LFAAKVHEPIKAHRVSRGLTDWNGGKKGKKKLEGPNIREERRSSVEIGRKGVEGNGPED